MKTRENKSKIWLTILIVFLMTSSILGFTITRSEDINRYTYNGYVFSKVNNRWLTYVNNIPLSLTFDPKSLESTQTPKINLNDLNSAEKIYITKNTSQNTIELQSEFLFNLQRFLKPRIVASCISDSEECKALPLKTCSDSSETVKVIFFEESNETELTYIDNCLKIKGSNEEIIKKIDKLILNLLGI